MTIQARKEAFTTISNVLAITRYDIEQHQVIADFSLNIHGENFFRDIFNFVYSANYINDNKESSNSAYIDLVDHQQKKFIQITTTRSITKLKNTLKIFKDNNYEDYSIEIFYLLNKANIQKSKIEKLESEFDISLKNSFKDYSDLIKEIDALDELKIIDLANKYFSDVIEKYSKELVLNIVCKKLIQDAKKKKTHYDEPLSSVDIDKKIDLNKLNDRVSAELKLALDYTPFVSSIDDSKTASELRELVVDKHYNEIIMQYLKSHYSSNELDKKTMVELQELAHSKNISFSMLISKLKDKISDLIVIEDFNGLKIPWVIVALYFELCLVGSDSNDISQ